MPTLAEALGTNTSSKKSKDDYGLGTSILAGLGSGIFKIFHAFNISSSVILDGIVTPLTFDNFFKKLSSLSKFNAVSKFSTIFFDKSLLPTGSCCFNVRSILTNIYIYLLN